MDKRKKQYMIAGIALAIVILGAVLIGRSTLFQGSLMSLYSNFKPSAISVSKYYNNLKNNIVSPVASPVPSIVVSQVPSQVGPSIVVSKVPSIIVSPVASGVPVTASLAKTLKLATLPKLTKSVLENAAKDDFMRNPAKYRLSPKEKTRLLYLYLSKRTK